MHDDKVNFPSKENSCQPLSKKTMKYMDLANERYDHARASEIRKRIVRKTGYKGAYILRKLPHHERYLDTPVEPMHLIKNIAEQIVHSLAGMEDSVCVQLEEKSRNRFCSS